MLSYVDDCDANPPQMKPKALTAVQTLAAFLLSATAFMPHAAADELVTYELDPIGARSNDFKSLESTFVTFRDTVGGDMTIVNVPGGQTIGNGLRVSSDIDGGALQMNFTVPVVFLSLAFGNDDPNWTVPGDLAMLSLFNGATPVGQIAVVLNRDDVMNQTIEFSGMPFTSAVFGLTNSNGTLFTGGGTAMVGSTELVDNIRFRLVPEPSAAALLLLGLSVGVIACRRLPTHKRGIVGDPLTIE